MEDITTPLSITRQVDAFLAKRPYYNVKHVLSLAESAIAEGMPFCLACRDWHHGDEPCSWDGDGADSDDAEEAALKAKQEE